MYALTTEQQILTLKVPISTKEKALSKLKEMKAKNDDAGSKARQYIEGFLKIPFQTFRHEPILQIVANMKSLCAKETPSSRAKETPSSRVESFADLVAFFSALNQKIHAFETNPWILCRRWFEEAFQRDAQATIETIFCFLKKHKENKKPFFSRKATTMDQRKIQLEAFLQQFCLQKEEETTSQNLAKQKEKQKEILSLFKPPSFQKEEFLRQRLDTDIQRIRSYMTEIQSTLDNAVYGHENAKREMQKIIGQWITGKADGYCFGFEGPPGVGKTSLAKHGLSQCLLDENQVPRPFAFLAVGGETNGSTLHGHNYTYVASTWGAIAQILMDKKCMNPIIFIDEVDKISRTEHGREFIGILTHLLDSTQNKEFQDKYFAGIELDLSKALFILSYNDAHAIDKILLDRVHQISFSALSIEEKVVVAKKHLLPEICAKMGLSDALFVADETWRFLIEEYTNEAGVRKLKEHIFDIVGEINLTLLASASSPSFGSSFASACLPFEKIIVTIDDIQTRFLKDKIPHRFRPVPEIKQIGYINGMYASASGNGGVLPFHANFFPAKTFLELKLTGLQQEIMRESMNVAFTVAWNRTSRAQQTFLRKMYNYPSASDFGNCCGINIHTGENAVAKDGPSGGCAIALVLYSLFQDLPIPPKIAVTGEIQLSGQVTAIGGLSTKIIGSVKQGVTTILYPKENTREFLLFWEKKHLYATALQNVRFYAIDTFEEAIAHVFYK